VLHGLVVAGTQAAWDVGSSCVKRCTVEIRVHRTRPMTPAAKSTCVVNTSIPFESVWFRFVGAVHSNAHIKKCRWNNGARQQDGAGATIKLQPVSIATRK
jgi:hypothetical protein